MDKQIEDNLIREYQETKSTSIRNKIIESHMGLIITLARKITRNNDYQNELVSEGVLTAISAIDKFDITKGFRFSTYLYKSVFNQMKKYTLRASDLLSMAKKSPNYSKIMANLPKEDTVDWSHKDVVNFAEKIGVKHTEVITIINTKSIAGGADAFLIDEEAQDIMQEVENDELLEKIKQYVDNTESVLSRESFLCVYGGVSTTNNLALHNLAIKHNVANHVIYQRAYKVRENLVEYLGVAV